MSELLTDWYPWSEWSPWQLNARGLWERSRVRRREVLREGQPGDPIEPREEREVETRRK